MILIVLYIKYIIYIRPIINTGTGPYLPAVSRYSWRCFTIICSLESLVTSRRKIFLRTTGNSQRYVLVPSNPGIIVIGTVKSGNIVMCH